MKPRKSELWLLLFPSVFFLILFIVVPSVRIIFASFQQDNLIQPARFIGLENYYNLIRDENFWQTLINSLLYVLVTPVLICVSLALALFVRTNTRINRISRLIFFLPVITPVVASGIMWKWLFNQEAGILNYLLGTAGITQVKWLTSFPENMFAVMILTIWRGAGYYMMIFLAGLAVINPDLEEAAILDGAGYFRRMFHIILPQLKPSVILVFVISSISAIKIFTEIYILIPGAPIANKTLVYFLFRESFERFNFGYGSAAGICLFALLLGFSVLNIKLMEGRERA